LSPPEKEKRVNKGIFGNGGLKVAADHRKKKRGRRRNTLGGKAGWGDWEHLGKKEID